MDKDKATRVSSVAAGAASLAVGAGLQLLGYINPLLGNVLIVAAVGGFLIAWKPHWATKRLWGKRSPHESPPTLPGVQRVRVLYSSKQVVEFSTVPGNYNETITLDNVALMVQADVPTRETIDMILQSTSPLTVNEPKSDEGYAIGGDLTIHFPEADEGWMTMAGFSTSGPGKRYHFDRYTSPVHIVEVNARRFRVFLLTVEDKSSAGHRLLAYTFGITEE